MSGKNVNKIYSFGLTDLAKRIQKNRSAHRRITSVRSFKKKVSNEPDYSNIISKSSATCEVKEAFMRKNPPSLDRRFEQNQAAALLSKCNTILKRHYLKKRKEQTKWLNGEFQSFPVLSKKLKDIMALNCSNTTTAPIQRDSFKQAHGIDNGECKSIDYKPQENTNVNRWHIKLPSQRVCDDLRSAVKKRVLKVKPPGMKTSLKAYEDRSKVLKTKVTNSKMWLIGAQRIPRLDQ